MRRGALAAALVLACVLAASAWAASPASPVPSLPVVKVTPPPPPAATVTPTAGAVTKPLSIPKTTATPKPLAKKGKAKATPTPVPQRTPDFRVKSGKAKDGFQFRVRPWRIPAGVWPKAVRFSPDGATAITTNFDSENITVIDVATQEVRETIDMGDKMVEAEWSPDGTELVVSGWLHDGFYDITVDGWKVRKVRVGDRPKGVTVSPDRTKAYAVNWGGDTVSVVDLATQLVTATIPVGGVPRWIAITRDGKTGLVTNFRGRSLSVLDLEKNEETGKIYGIQNPRHIVLSADESIAYVTDREGGKLHAVSMAKKKVLWSVAVGNRPKTVDLSNDELYAFTANYGSDDVGVVRLKDHKLIARIPAGKSPSGIEVAPDGKSVWVSNWYDYDVSIIDVAWPKGAQETLPAASTAAQAPPGSRPMYPKGSISSKLVADQTPPPVTKPVFLEPLVTTSAGLAAKSK